MTTDHDKIADDYSAASSELEIAYIEADLEFKRAADEAFLNPTQENIDAFFAAEKSREIKRRDWINSKYLLEEKQT